jgi:hypothetical protein
MAMRTLLVPLAALALAAPAAPAAPLITEAIQDGGRITIHGAGLGEAELVQWDDFSIGVHGSSLRDWWIIRGGACRGPIYDAEMARAPGRVSALQHYHPNPDCWGQGIGIDTLDVSRLYFSGWYYLRTEGTSRNVKLVSVRGQLESERPWQARFQYQPLSQVGTMYATDCDLDNDVEQEWFTYDMMPDAWHRFEFWLDAGTPQGGAVWQVWIDGNLLADIDGTFLSYDCLDTPGRVSMGMYYEPTDGAEAWRWWDEMYFSNSRARVEIGNAPEWTRCTHREIQPHTAWSDYEIVVTENAGTLDGERWLYVVDAGGAASDGFLLDQEPVADCDQLWQEAIDALEAWRICEEGGR